jgi:hypothetical protein
VRPTCLDWPQEQLAHQLCEYIFMYVRMHACGGDLEPVYLYIYIYVCIYICICIVETGVDMTDCKTLNLRETTHIHIYHTRIYAD